MNIFSYIIVNVGIWCYRWLLSEYAIQFPFSVTKIDYFLFRLFINLWLPNLLITTERIKVKAYKNFFKTGGD